MQFESVADYPRAWGEPLASARLKSTPEDFIVRESLDFDFDGLGEHWYLHIRKCGLNTSDILDKLQVYFKCGSADIGVSGLKDKNAVTDQWFSVRSPMPLEDTPLVIADSHAGIALGEFVVLESHRHGRKLRRGAHRHNRFIITLRELTATDLNTAQTEIDERLKNISEHGFVNYFGPQRFGIGQQNLVKAERYFANPKRKMSRVQRGLLISSARSLLFNQVCAARVSNATWNKPMQGEPMLLDGSHSYFVNDETLNDTDERCDAHDVHPTGPLWGEGDTVAQGECGQFETEILQTFKPFINGLEQAGLKQQRRALRAPVENLQWQWIDMHTITLDFNLHKGVYATSFLAEVVLCP